MKLDLDIPEGHPSQESRAFHPQDDKLRAAGFRILARPEGGQARWQHRVTHAVYLESDALAQIKKAEQEIGKKV